MDYILRVSIFCYVPKIIGIYRVHEAYLIPIAGGFKSIAPQTQSTLLMAWSEKMTTLEQREQTI